MNKDLFELVQIAIGKRKVFSHILSEVEWDNLYHEVRKQFLLGVCYPAVVQLPQEQRPDKVILMRWFGRTEAIKNRNTVVSRRTSEVYHLFANGMDTSESSCAFRSVVLKGQGAALLYDHNDILNPNLRTPGDIDLWVDGERSEVIDFMKKKGWKVGESFIHHTDVEIFPDVEVEVHHIPSFSYCPFRNHKYKKWFRAQAKIQMKLMDQKVGFAHPSIDFNAVYSLLHIFRHVFHEGIGLRQLMDYYFILQHIDEQIRLETIKILKWFGLERFAAAIMYVEQTIFASQEEIQRGCVSSKGYVDWLLCEPDPEMGQFLLEDIIQNGNFGKYNEQTREAHSKGKLSLFLHNVSRLIKMIKLNPSEVIWAPFWKPTHYFWRKLKGY